MLEPDAAAAPNTGAAMRIQASGAEQRRKSGDSPERSQLLCLHCQDEMRALCPGTPQRSPRRTLTTRLSSGSADRDPSSGSYNASTGTFYSCVSQITIGFDLGGQVAIEFSHWNSPLTENSANLPSPDTARSEGSALPVLSERLEAVSCPASLSLTPLSTSSQDTICDCSIAPLPHASDPRCQMLPSLPPVCVCGYRNTTHPRLQCSFVLIGSCQTSWLSDWRI
uniref:Uncharacterized protein n=1 Tax=Knipowitschia caucasica TaxID=637954 RepID=A0AAV2IVU3_KNICA